MKKLLLGATALTMVGFVGAASAQTVSSPRFNTSVGGFMTMGLGYVGSEGTDQDDGNEFIVVNNAEVIFNFSLVADNGLTFGAKVEFEANSGGSSGVNADEYVGFVRGSFGTIEVGAEDGAHDILVGGPVGGNFTAAADGGGFLFDYTVGDGGEYGRSFTGRSQGVVAPNTQGNDTGDGLKVTYYTPTFAGFRAGISAAPNNSEGPTATPVTGQTGRGIELGAQYNNTFGGVSLFLAGGVTFFDESETPAATGERDIAYTGNIQIGFAGFKVGGIYGLTTFESGEDNSAFGLGAEYRTGPWFFGLQYGQNLDARPISWRATSNGPVASRTYDDAYAISGEVNYALAPGVTTGFVVEYASDSFAVSGGSATVAPTVKEGEAIAAGVFLGLSF